MIRITGGVFRGRAIKSPPGSSSRPTLERVREALFDVVGNRLEGTRFLDLYAGVGLVGIEALSRGADEAVFVEKGLAFVKIMRENLKKLGIESRSKIFHGSASALALRLAKNPFDFVFLDPPYGSGEVLKILVKLGYGDLDPRTEFVVQHHYKDLLPEKAGNLARQKQKRYGETLLSFYRARIAGD